MHKVFTSYHHENDQHYKEELLKINDRYKQLSGDPIFIDKSVDKRDISEDLPDETIRQTIRDDYLQDSTVTILLVGTETKNRKHIDWELYSSMYDGKKNKKSGILVVNLPEVSNIFSIIVDHENHQEQNLYPEIQSWQMINKRNECERRCPYVPDRIIDNLLNPKARISVTNWNKITNPEILKYLIDVTFMDRENCDYDLSRPMRRQNFNQPTSFNAFSFLAPNR